MLWVGAVLAVVVVFAMSRRRRAKASAPEGGVPRGYLGPRWRVPTDRWL